MGSDKLPPASFCQECESHHPMFFAVVEATTSKRQDSTGCYKPYRHLDVKTRLTDFTGKAEVIDDPRNAHTHSLQLVVPSSDLSA